MISTFWKNNKWFGKLSSFERLNNSFWRKMNKFLAKYFGLNVNFEYKTWKFYDPEGKNFWIIYHYHLLDTKWTILG